MSTLSNYLIPLSAAPQLFEIELAGVNYTLTCKWNDQPDAGWILDIEDENSNPICCNIPLVTGIDLLFGLEYLNIGGSLYVVTAGSSPDDVPTYTNLGIDCNLYFQTSNTNE
jgi:hypothetical protein